MSLNLLSDDVEVLQTASQWMSQGQSVALVTVLRTWGSSPRPPGSLLAIGEDGHYVGSVSGGCVEETLVARHTQGELGGDTPSLVDFGVNREEASRLGLPCGGRLEVLVELLDFPAPVDALLAKLEQRELVTRSVCLNTGEVSLHAASGEVEFSITDANVSKVFGPTWELLLVGNGQIARHIATMAIPLDYRIIICDPREEYTALPELDGVTYSTRMPDDEVAALSNSPRTAIVTLAHDPRQDDLALSAALESGAFYIGALGSRRTSKTRRDRLSQLGYTEEQISRIHGPAGLDIGSKKPGEIALSILAGITAVRNGVISRTQAATESA